MSKEAHKHYQVLKSNKELNEVFEKATGDWEKDKVKFTKLYNENIKFVIDFENDLLDDDDMEENDYIDDTFL